VAGPQHASFNAIWQENAGQEDIQTTAFNSTQKRFAGVFHRIYYIGKYDNMFAIGLLELLVFMFVMAVPLAIVACVIFFAQRSNRNLNLIRCPDCGQGSHVIGL
jgi:hypothetical protein